MKRLFFIAMCIVTLLAALSSLLCVLLAVESQDSIGEIVAIVVFFGGATVSLGFSTYLSFRWMKKVKVIPKLQKRPILKTKTTQGEQLGQYLKTYDEIYGLAFEAQIKSLDCFSDVETQDMLTLIFSFKEGANDSTLWEDELYGRFFTDREWKWKDADKLREIAIGLGLGEESNSFWWLFINTTPEIVFQKIITNRLNHRLRR